MDHTRHIGIFNANQYAVTLIGAGGIGAMSALALAKMGVGGLTIFDGDAVDDVNIPVQFHKLSDIGKSKAAAIDSAIQEYVDGLSVRQICQDVTSSTFLRPTHVTISAVDSIRARKDIWMAVEKQRPEWYIDARMSAEYLQMYLVNMANYRWYQDTLAG